MFNILPKQIKFVLNKYTKSEEEKKEALLNIYFITDQKDFYLDVYLEDSLLKKFKEFKNRSHPGEIIDINIYNEVIFYERRLNYARIDEPAWEEDILVSNLIEIEIINKNIYCAEKKKGISLEDIRNELKSRNKCISFIFKYGKIFSFRNFDEYNPLTKFIDEKSKIEKIDFETLDDKDAVYFLNDWLYNHLISLNLKYYKKKNHRLFFFHSKNINKVIYWYDPISKKRKEWTVVQNRTSHYLNVGAEINITKYQYKFIMIIVPKLLFSKDGEDLLKSECKKKFELKYRKVFVKNDYLRRWFYMLLSFIKKEEIQTEQTDILKFLEEKTDNLVKYHRKIFLDKNVVKFKEPFTIQTNFKPNNESKKNNSKERK